MEAWWLRGRSSVRSLLASVGFFRTSCLHAPRKQELGCLVNSVITGNDVCSLIPYSHGGVSPAMNNYPGREGVRDVPQHHMTIGS
jgi:hypothetical protein